MTTQSASSKSAFRLQVALVCLLTPCVIHAQDSSKDVQNRLKILMLTMHNYHDAQRGFPAQAIVGADGKPLLSWRVAILPFLNQRELYLRFKLDEAWDSPTNKALLQEMPKELTFPGDESNALAGKTRLVGIAGPGFSFSKGAKGNSIRAFRDGTSNSAVLTVLAADKAVPWTKPEDFEPTKDGPAEGLAVFEGKWLFALGDGSVQSVSTERAKDVHALFTIAGGENVSLFDPPADEPMPKAAQRPANPRDIVFNNIKQIMLMMHNSHDAYRAFPPVSGPKPEIKGLSWRVVLLQFLDEGELYGKFKLDEPWDGPNNRKLITQMPKVFRHPTNRTLNASGKTCYLGVAGEGFAIGLTKGISIRQFADGTSNTAMIVVVDPDNAVPWTKPEDWTPTKDDPLRGLADIAGKSIFGFADGSVRSLSRHHPEEIWKIFTINGSEIVDFEKIGR